MMSTPIRARLKVGLAHIGEEIAHDAACCIEQIVVNVRSGEHPARSPATAPPQPRRA